MFVYSIIIHLICLKKWSNSMSLWMGDISVM